MADGRQQGFPFSLEGTPNSYVRMYKEAQPSKWRIANSHGSHFQGKATRELAREDISLPRHQ